MKIKSNGEINYKAIFKNMELRTFEAHIIAKEFGLNPYEIEEDWGDFQIAQTMSFVKQIYKKK